MNYCKKCGNTKHSGSCYMLDSELPYMEIEKENKKWKQNKKQKNSQNLG